MNHKGVQVTTSLGSDYESYLLKLRDIITTRTGVIPTQHANRPDLISDIFYDTPANWWVIMEVNDINDPFENLNAGDPVKIPLL